MSKIFSKCGILVIVSLAIVFVGVSFAEQSRPTIRSVYSYVQLPESWTVELLKEYKDIGINLITVTEHWSQFEKEPGKFDFSNLGKVLNNIRVAGLKSRIMLQPEFVPAWVWTYGKEQKLTNEELGEMSLINGGKKIDVNKISVYPSINADGKVVYLSGICPWHAIGNFLKCRYISNACHYLEENYADVVEYVDAGYLCEGIWCLSGTITPTWSPTALGSYRRYLQEIYGDVKDPNKIYKKNWKNLDEPIPPRTYEDTKYFWDWYKWYERGMVALFMREAAIVRRAGFKVSVLSHFASGGMINPAENFVEFRNTSRIGLIDADLYNVGGGFCNITWDPKRPYDQIKNPPFLAPYDNVQIMQEIKRKKPETLFIIEDWAPNPVLAEFIGLPGSMIDGFLVVPQTFFTKEKGQLYIPREGKQPEELYKEFKDAIRTFFLWEERK